MITVQYQYPGDPIESAQLLFGVEFLQANPNRQIVFSSTGRPDTQIPVDEIICDNCNAEVGVLDPCAVTLHRLYCWDCANEWVLKYVDVDAAILV